MSIEELRVAEAEARALASLGHHPFCTSDWETPGPCNCAFGRQQAALDAYAAAVRATLESEVEALVDAAIAFDTFIQMVDSGMSVFPFDPEHEDSEPKVYERVREALGRTVQPFLARRGR